MSRQTLEDLGRGRAGQPDPGWRRARLGFEPTPPDLAVFDTTLAAAATVLCADEAAVAALGLPQVGGLLDFTDVANAALHSGTGTTLPEMARRLLMRFAAGEPDRWYAPLDWTVAVHQPPTGETLQMAVPDLDAEGVELLDDPAADQPRPVVPDGHQADPYQVRVRLTGERYDVTDRRIHAAFDDVLAALHGGAVHYQAIAEPLRADHRRSWELGVADCVVAGRVLADRLRAEGFQARARRGFLLGLIGNDHGWCEVHLDGQWRPLDPVFAYLAAEHGRDSAARFETACRGGRFNRVLPCAVAESAALFLSPDGSPAPAWAVAAVSSRLRRAAARA
ncbi:transglutaminase domain-containing protein [Pseudofrankia sp. BMG5.36]|uniref:transglutaminase domain-containing protein n=1 Tax=Pseudofrankia sp. BMG5.36 TaxID=1834512 RepID=UPI000A7F3A8B|nr:transglutaminase domain-containing protein [Pseudofrankia sp. BMG5.36]